MIERKGTKPAARLFVRQWAHDDEAQIYACATEYFRIVKGVSALRINISDSFFTFADV